MHRSHESADSRPGSATPWSSWSTPTTSAWPPIVGVDQLDHSFTHTLVPTVTENPSPVPSSARAGTWNKPDNTAAATRHRPLLFIPAPQDRASSKCSRDIRLRCPRSGRRRFLARLLLAGVRLLIATCDLRFQLRLLSPQSLHFLFL